MADNARHGQEPMYCHACHHQWPRDGEKMECPACMSASTEIIDLDHDPRHFHNQQETASTSGAPNPTSGQGINPEDTSPNSATPSQSSNDETQNSTENSAENSTGTTDTTSSNTSTPQTADEPSTRVIFYFVPQITFAAFTPTTNMSSPPEGESPEGESLPPNSEPVPPGSDSTSPRFVPTSRWHFTFSHAAVPPAPPADSTNPNFLNPEQQQSPPNPPSTTAAAAATTENNPHPALPALLTMITALGAPLSTYLNQHNNNHHHNAGGGLQIGDAVFSDAALDAIISRLREQTPAGGPPPASKEAVEALRVRRVGCCCGHDGDVCGDEDCVVGEGEGGKCVVCVEEFGKGEEVAVLPCEHFFHGECVKTWLGLHGTCPVCRASVEVSRDGKKGVRKEGVDGGGDGDGGVVGRGEMEVEMDTETETQMSGVEGEEGGRGDRAIRNLFNDSGRRAEIARGSSDSIFWA